MHLSPRLKPETAAIRGLSQRISDNLTVVSGPGWGFRTPGPPDQLYVLRIEQYND